MLGAVVCDGAACLPQAPLVEDVLNGWESVASFVLCLFSDFDFILALW